MTRARTSPLVRIFIGESLQHRSEYDCLKEVWKSLSERGGWADIFANFHVQGRQLDLVVFSERTTVVIEAKGYSLPVRGGANGQWEQLGPYGVRKIGNAYSQAWSARNALRDEIGRDREVDGYPNGLVVVTPHIPKGSKIETNFKIAITELEQVAEELNRTSGALLTRCQSETLANRLRLEEVQSVDAALDEEVLIAERAHQGYRRAFRDFHAPRTASLVSDEYTFGDIPIKLSEVHALVLTNSTGIVIHGPSGCGKTLLTTSCAVTCLDANCVPILVGGGNFEGSFQRLLDKEVALLSVTSTKKLIRAARLLGMRIILFLDGYNECPDDLKITLTRSLRAFALRYDAGIVVSTQQDIARPNLLVTHFVTVNRPSEKLKASLANLTRADPAGNLRSLLQVADSGLEAALVGQVGAVVPVVSSRFGLFDTYARIKLGAAASEGIRVLSAIAETLIIRPSFSLSVREFDRLFDSLGAINFDRQRLVRAKLLHIRGDRISFVHELFFSAFAAEFAMRSSNGDAPTIRAVLASPRFSSSKAFIVGAIEDDGLLHRVLDGLDDPSLLAACSRGECGPTAQTIVKRKIMRTLDAMVNEAQGLEFRIIGEGWNAIEVVRGPHQNELGNFDVYLGAIGDGLAAGHYLDSTMAACRSVDNAIANFTSAKISDAKLKKIPLRHDVFSAAYVTNRSSAVSQLVNFVHSGGLSFRRHKASGLAPAILEAWQQAQTPGQFYFLIGLTNSLAYDKGTAHHVARLLKTVTSHPYHLQLGLIDFAQHLRDADEPYLTEIIDALAASVDKLGPMMNTIIFEALNRLGALEEDQQLHTSVVRDEIQSTLSSDSPESDQAAWGIFSCQFDHPFELAYWDEIEALDEERKKRLLIKACRGAHERYVSFLGILIRQLSSFNDPNVAPAISRWTALPDKTSFMPQDAVEVFVTSYEALGRLGANLPAPPAEPSNEADEALLACGVLFYWASRIEVGDVETSTHTVAAQSTLLERCLNSAAGALQLTTSWMLSADGTRASLVKKYPRMSAQICRGALESLGKQISYFEHGFKSDPNSIACFAIHILGDVGDLDDLAALRELCDNTEYGTVSLDAIKSIEDRRGFRRE